MAIAALWLLTQKKYFSLKFYSSMIKDTTHTALIESVVMLEHGLKQIVNQPTWHQNILDLFFLMTSTLSTSYQALEIMILFLSTFMCSTKCDQINKFAIEKFPCMTKLTGICCNFLNEYLNCRWALDKIQGYCYTKHEIMHAYHTNLPEHVVIYHGLPLL